MDSKVSGAANNVETRITVPILRRIRVRSACYGVSRLTPQFSGGAVTYVPWHFIHHRPLQLLVRRPATALDFGQCSIAGSHGPEATHRFLCADNPLEHRIPRSDA